MMNSVDTVTYQYKAALLLLIYSMLTSFTYTLDYFVYKEGMKHLSGVGSTDIDRGAAAGADRSSFADYGVQCDPEMASV